MISISTPNEFINMKFIIKRITGGETIIIQALFQQPAAADHKHSVSLLVSEKEADTQLGRKAKMELQEEHPGMNLTTLSLRSLPGKLRECLFKRRIEHKLARRPRIQQSVGDVNRVKAFIIYEYILFLNPSPFFSLASNLYSYLSHGVVQSFPRATSPKSKQYNFATQSKSCI